jgi:hypothetical protein
MLELWIALAFAVAVCAGALLALSLHKSRISRRADSARRTDPADTSAPDEATLVRRFPSSGLLVPESVLSQLGADVSVWEALESASVPMAFEYYPITNTDLAKYTSVPVNASMQQALTDIVKAVGPKSPTLFKAVLPKGAKLVEAVGKDGFRGFSRTGGKTVHAVLKPVGIGGAAVAGWPILAVAGSVMAMDMLAQRELRAHQRRVETILGRQERRHEVGRIAAQRTTDERLSAAISHVLDGQVPHLEVALDRAGVEFHTAAEFLKLNWSLLQVLTEVDGAVDYRELEVALGGETRDLDHFIRELHFARVAVALGRKALLTEAASAALADPENPYLALRKFLERRAVEVEQAEGYEAQVTAALSTLQLKGRWHESQKSITARQITLRQRVAPPQIDPPETVQYVALPSGEIHQLVPVDAEADEDAANLATTSVTGENSD